MAQADRAGAPVVAILSPDPSSNLGGVERFCHNLAGVVKARGWIPVIVGPEQIPSLPAKMRPFYPFMLSASAIRAAEDVSADLVISNGFLGAATTAPRIHVYHGVLPLHALHSARRPSKLTMRLAFGGVAEARAGHGASRVAVSARTASEVSRVYRLSSHHVIPNGVDTVMFSAGDKRAAREALGLSADARYSLFVGRSEYRKGADLLRAAGVAGFDLIAAGASAPEGARALGPLPPSQMALAYRAADCVLFPTRYEACSFVVLEALAVGVPLITTDRGWMNTLLERLPEYRHFIVRPREREIVQALKRLETDDTQEMRASARKLIESECSLSPFGRRWIEAMEMTIGIRPS
jgi:glycosyltransferase involved in cell wall biosynthesis